MALPPAPPVPPGPGPSSGGSASNAGRQTAKVLAVVGGVFTFLSMVGGIAILIVAENDKSEGAEALGFVLLLLTFPCLIGVVLLIIAAFVAVTARSR